MNSQMSDPFEGILYTASFEKVLLKADNLSQEERSFFVNQYRQFTSKSLLNDDKLRVSVVRALVALLPESSHVIKEWLSESRFYEIHFTLFCYLDWVADWPRLIGLKGEILTLIKTYLLKVKRNSGSAAWMAGDLLGDHWPPNEAAVILINVLRNAKYAAGRRGALYGVEMLMRKSELSLQHRDDVAQALLERAKKEQNRILRQEAFELAQKLGFI